MSKEYMNDGSLSEKWKYRFNFYDQHGFPGFWGATPEYKAAFKALKVRQRLRKVRISPRCEIIVL